jgi:membrane-associated phospholipid phosphatase
MRSSLFARPGVVFVAALLCFLLLALWVAVGDRPAWDEALVAQALDHRPAELRDAMLALARASSSLGAAIVAAAIVAWLLLRRRTGDALFVAVAASGAGLLTLALKPLFGEARPTIAEPLGPASGFAFPSGHAISTMAIVAAAFAVARWRSPRLAVLLLGGLLVVGVGASRVFLTAHYPSDVLAGWCVAIAWVAGLRALSSRAGRLFAEGAEAERPPASDLGTLTANPGQGKTL